LREKIHHRGTEDTEEKIEEKIGEKRRRRDKR